MNYGWHCRKHPTILSINQQVRYRQLSYSLKREVYSASNETYIRRAALDGVVRCGKRHLLGGLRFIVT